MTRILAFADTQIGVSTVDLDDQREVLDRIVGTALIGGVDLVVHGGDVFEGPLVMPEHLRCFIDATEPLRRDQIPMLVIRGNGRHDMATRTVNALDVLREIEGITVADRPEVWPGRDLKPLDFSSAAPEITIVTLPWVHPGHLLARLDGNVDRDEVNQTIARMLITIAGNLYQQTEGPAVLVAHWAITGAKLPTGLAVEQMREPVIPWADLDAIGYDAVIGAHIHEPQQISQPLIDQTLGIVVGSPQQLNHGEHGDHGCWIIDIKDGERGTAVSTEFVSIPSRRFVTLDFAEEDLSTENMGWGIPEGAIVRVRLPLSEEAARGVDYDLLRRQLMEAGAHKVSFDIKVQRGPRARVEDISEQMSQVDALARWCDANEIKEGLRRRMRETLIEWGAA